MNYINCGGKLLSLEKPLVMGILNVTPDSFYDGGHFEAVDSALAQAKKMVAEGASIIDVGGMSSRPGAEIIDVTTEVERVVPIINAIVSEIPDLIVSIDTIHGSVAKASIDAGATMINDISGGEIDNTIWQVAQKEAVPYILMHMQGKPNTMQLNPSYENVGLDILTYLRDKVYALKQMGVNDVIIDPGFGFGKTVGQNYELLRSLSSFRILECPILVGMSRKSMIYKVLDTTASEALNGSTAAHMVALQNGAKILRVHDVRAAVECVKIYNHVINESNNE